MRSQAIARRLLVNTRELVTLVSEALLSSCRLCGFEPFFDPRGDQYMYSRILNCDYEFVSPWWDEVSLNAKDLVSRRNLCADSGFPGPLLLGWICPVPSGQ